METGLYSLEEWRDIWLIIYCAIGALLFFLGCLIAGVSGFFSYRILRKTNDAASNLKPAAQNVLETTGTIKGTVVFISEKAVMPVVRAYGAYAGARRFVSVMARFTRPKASG
jgi:hypothetical protein